MDYHYFWMGGMWMFPFIGIIIFVCCIFFIVRGFGCGSGGCGPWFSHRGSEWDRRRNTDAALDILNQRYAKGEITKEEYDKMKKDILGG